MPPVVAAIAAVVSAVSSVITAIGAWFATFGAVGVFVGKVLFYVATSAILSAIAKAFSPTPEYDSGSRLDQGYQIALKFDPNQPRQVVVGRAATGGSVAYSQVTGTGNKYLWRVIVLSDNPSNGINQVLGGGEALTFDGDITTGWRSCTSHYQKADGSDCLQMRVYLGAQVTVDSTLNAASPAAEWSATHIGKGLTYAICRFEYDAEAFSTGEPDLIFVVDGVSALDPRTATTAWTRNGALLAAQFAKGWSLNGIRVVGLGAGNADVPDTPVEDGADICDEDVALLAGGTEDRYQVNGLIGSYDAPTAVLADLALAMGGQHVNAGGEIQFLPGVARTPVHALGRALDDGDLLSDESIEWAPDRAGDELCNTIHSTFVDPSAAWREGALPIRKDTAAITADGERFVKNRSYRFVTSATQGQRLNKLALTETRYQGRIALPLGLWALVYEPGDWEEFTSANFGGATKTFRVESVAFQISNGSDGEPSARVMVTMVEVHASIDDWSTADEAGVDGAYPAETPLVLTMNALTVTAAVLNLGGSSVPQVRVSWTALGNPVASAIDFEYRAQGDNTIIYRASATPDATTINFDAGVMPSQTYEVRARIRVIDRVGVWTSWTAHSGTTSSILIDAPLVAEPFAPGRIGGNGDFIFYLDKTDAVTVDIGEIYIAAAIFNHPDGTPRTTGLTGTVLTQYGEGASGRFYLIYSATAKATRFGTLGSQGSATNIFAARPKTGGGWEAIDNAGGVANVTIAATDCIVALVEAETTSSGLTGIAPFVAGAAGIDGADGTDGADGADGNNVQRVRIYRRLATSPTLPSATATVTFSTGGITGLNNGWTATIPTADGNPLWVSEATAMATTATDTIASGEWASAVILDGAGLNAATAYLYKRGAAAPAVPSATLTYTFSTGVLSGTLDSWTQTIPDGNDSLWVITATALAATATDTIATGEWATPRNVAQDGNSAFPITLSAGLSRSAAGVITKTTTDGWNEQAYGPVMFSGGAYASARVLQTNARVMFGLNTDPTLNASYTSIDYAIYAKDAGNLEVYESGVGVTGLGTYVANDVLSVVYDGARVRYLKNGTIVRTVAAAAGLRLGFDSSFYDQNVAIDGVAYGPLATAPTRTESRFKRSVTAPSAPTGDDPSGWTVAVPSGTSALWRSDAQKDASDVLVGTWSSPILISGLSPRGAWASGSTYSSATNDWVTYNGGSYLALLTGFTSNVSTISSASWSGGVATINASAAHGITNGDYVEISAVTPTGYNVRGIATYVDTDTITIPITTNPGAYTSGGSLKNKIPTGTGDATAYWGVLAAPGSPGTPGDPSSPFTATIDLSSSSSGINLRTVADNAGYTGSSDATITFEVESGVTITGAVSGIGVDSGTWPTSSYTIALTMTVKSGGIIRGGGGNGGDGGNGPSGAGGAGDVGGDAIYLRVPFTGGITFNTGSEIKGGGGGGGGGNAKTVAETNYGGSGGGGGAPNGLGGALGTGSDIDGVDGSDGTTSGGGAGGNAAISNDGGGGGTYATTGSTAPQAGGAGGAGGYCVRKNGHSATVTNNGTTAGTIG